MTRHGTGQRDPRSEGMCDASRPCRSRIGLPCLGSRAEAGVSPGGRTRGLSESTATGRFRADVHVRVGIAALDAEPPPMAQNGTHGRRSSLNPV